MARKSSKESVLTVTPQQVEEFERVAGQLLALHQEFVVQAKPKPDNPINKFKLKMVNEKLASANALLTGPFRPFADFAVFEEADLPTNSDVALVLSTYLASLERWRSARVESDAGSWMWRTTDGEEIRARRPTSYAPPEQ